MAGSKKYRRWEPRQAFLLPPSPYEWLPDDHLALFLLDVVEFLDLSAIEEQIQAKDSRGTRPYHPRMMVALLVYAYCTGLVSSRRIERATWEDVPFRVLAGGQHPDHNTISKFRKDNIGVLGGLFVQTLRLCQEAGLVKLGRVALDGTKLKANASKHKAMSYGRMLKAEAELKAEIEALFAQAQATDDEEDDKFGEGRRGEELPEELRRREDRLARIREAKAALEREAAEARAQTLESRAAEQQDKSETSEDSTEAKRAATHARKNAAKAEKLRDEHELGPAPEADDDAAELPEHRVPATPEAKPTHKAQRNFTDPDSRIMVSGGAYIQGYNAQAIVDREHQIIVATGLSNQPPDNQYLRVLTDQAIANCGRAPEQLLADSGYWSAANVAFLEERGIDPYIATGRQKHGGRAPDREAQPPPETDDANAKEAMRLKLAEPAARDIYSERKFIVEPVFGQIKEPRGLRGLLLRGLEAARCEWDLICTGHNLLKLHRARVAF